MFNNLTSQEDFSAWVRLTQTPSLPDNNQKVSQADKLLQQSHTVYEETQRPREINQSSTCWTFSHELHQCAALWAGLSRKRASVQVQLSSGEVKCDVCVFVPHLHLCTTSVCSLTGWTSLSLSCVQDQVLL